MLQSTDFLSELRDGIRTGLARTPVEYQKKHAAWIAAQQRPEGGFANRRGRADLYYTTFALRSLSALNVLTPAVAQPAADYLKSLFRQPDTSRTRQPHGAFSDAVNAASWWDSLRLCEEVLGSQLSKEEQAEAADATHNRLNVLRRDDGGWAKTDIDACGSLYHSFLAACAYSRLGVAQQLRSPLQMLTMYKELNNLKTFVQSMVQPDGGFLENRFSKRPGTNGCAAGVALCLALDLRINADAHAAVIAGMFSGEGGFYATQAAPIADLLSTYTALYTLKSLGKLDDRHVDGAARYARSLEQVSGGYTGFALETVVDCEYTFYGLGIESIVCMGGPDPRR